MADRPRIHTRRWPSLVTPLALGIGASLSSVTGLGAWLVLSDPAVAVDVAASGDLVPLMEAIVESLRSALAGWLAYL
jgi:hypothetical protein